MSSTTQITNGNSERTVFLLGPRDQLRLPADLPAPARDSARSNWWRMDRLGRLERLVLKRQPLIRSHRHPRPLESQTVPVSRSSGGSASEVMLSMPFIQAMVRWSALMMFPVLLETVEVSHCSEWLNEVR